MTPMLRFRRLWSDGVVSDIWTGYSLVTFWRFVYSVEWSGVRGRVWIERAGQPAAREWLA
jgi:hypothetical protein